MAKRRKDEAKHLGQEKDTRHNKGRHRGRKVLAAVLVCAAIAGAGAYATYEQGLWPVAGEGAGGNDQTDAQEGQDQSLGDASADEAAANAATDETANDNANASNASANEGENATADETPQHVVGQHDTPTADQQASMAALKGQIAVTGAAATFADSAGYQELLYQVAVWQAAGRSLGFILTDLGSGATVSYNTDQVFYPASSIKAPFVCSLYQEVVESGGSESQLDPLAQRTIVDSDNDAFRQLHQNYGESAFSAWLSAAGVPATAGYGYGYFTQYYYPHVSTSQLNLMWSAIYRYCTSGTGASQTFASYLASRTTSPIAQAVGSREQSWGKAGWYYSSGDYGAEPATVDAGVVFAEKGPYQLVMMSGAPGELDAMAELAYGMDQAAQDLAA